MMALESSQCARYTLLLSLIWLLIVPVTAGVVNRTIDDTFGDSDNGKKVTYLPATNVWEDQSCTGCSIQPDTSQAFKNTFTAATYNPGLGSMSIEMEFEGFAIWVFFILANNAGDGITSLTMANFTLDGGTPTPYQHAPDLTTRAIQYNQLAFSQTGLVNARHKLVISTTGNSNIFVNFDYAIYTHDDDGVLDPSPPPGGRPVSSTSTSTRPTSTSSITDSLTKTQTLSRQSSTTSKATPSGGLNNNNTAGSAQKSNSVTGIVGGVIGGIAGAVLLFFLVMCLMRRQRRRAAQLELDEKGWTAPDPVVTPFYNPNGPNTHNPNMASYSSINHLQSHGYNTQGSRTQPTSPHSPKSNRSARQIPPPLPQSEAAYGGYTSAFGGSNSVGGSSESTYPRFVSVTDGDHISTPHRSMVASTTNAMSVASTGSTGGWVGSMNPKDRSDIRRERQRELDERMRHVQAEMNHLAADLTGQKPSRGRSLRRPQGASATTREDDMSMEEMREQLRVMTSQVAYLRNQQQSAWALGLSDDPPPGYEPMASSPPPHSQQLQSHT